MLQNIINNRTEEAESGLHNYLLNKSRSIMNLPVDSEVEDDELVDEVPENDE